ncbi:FG-GAP-like repeat-containing protein [Phenylobacterium sp.]|uniref:FG-GAP-like repeat-containing protein n=1 Tax=Phenylobacterium sp. TaxID=1871053 RepID=UPI002F9429E6
MPNYFVGSTIAVSSDYVGAVNQVVPLDLNGDGHLDLLIADTSLKNSGTPLRALLGDGKGGFSDGTASVFGSSVPQTISARGSAVADFNGDGRPDVYFGDQGFDEPPFPGAHNTLIVSSGAGYVAAVGVPGQSDFTHSVAAADVDGDGDIDIYVNNLGQGDRAPYLLVNDGRGQFTLARLAFASEGSFTDCLFFYADGDTHPDLFLGGDLSMAASTVLLNDGRGVFGSPIVVPKPNGRIVSDSEAVDLNGDGRLDLVLIETTHQSVGGYVQVLINTPHGFVDETDNRLLGLSGGQLGPYWAYEVFAADMNGDGSVDIVLSQGVDSDSSPLLINNGSGQFVRMPVTLPNLTVFQKLTVGDANGDGLTDILAVEGNAGGERIHVYLNSHPGHTQTGTASNDGLMGSSGGNTILSGAGNDTVAGGSGQNFLRGEEGDDLIVGGPNFDDAHGNMGNDTVYGGLGDDWVVGGKDNDLLFGDEGWDIVYGNLGNDTCEGGAFIDWVRGGQGDDLVDGGAGDDWLWGDRGSDTVTGGSGADTFFFHGEAGIDRITDFNFGDGDRIKVEFGTYTVQQIGADTVLDFGGGNQLVLLGMSGFSTNWLV